MWVLWYLLCSDLNNDAAVISLSLSFSLHQVYQYMHETITVNGCPEYQARATAKVGMAAIVIHLASMQLLSLWYTVSACENININIFHRCVSRSVST